MVLSKDFAKVSQGLGDVSILQMWCNQLEAYSLCHALVRRKERNYNIFRDALLFVDDVMSLVILRISKWASTRGVFDCLRLNGFCKIGRPLCFMGLARFFFFFKGFELVSSYEWHAEI